MDIIGESQADRIPVRQIISRPQAVSDFADVELRVDGLSLDVLTENCIRNYKLAAALAADDPDAADRLVRCCQYLREEPDGRVIPSYRCRLHRFCSSCHATRSQHIRQQYADAALAEEQRTGKPLLLKSFVLHPQLPDKLHAEDALRLSLLGIKTFGDVLSRRVADRHRAGTASIFSSIGPMLLSTHINPEVSKLIKGRRVAKATTAHLHVLAAVPPRTPINKVRDAMDDTWQLAMQRIGGDWRKLAVAVNRRNLACEDTQHVANLVAYTARYLKARWLPHQVLAIDRVVQTTGLRTMLRLVGCQAEPRKSLPHRYAITGDVLRFSAAKLRFEKINVKEWV